MSSWVCGSEDKKESRGQSKRGSWEEKNCRREEKEEKIGVSPIVLGWDTSRGCCSFRRHWGILDHGI